MNEQEISLKLRDYEIDRIVNKIMNWHPSCKIEGVRELLEYVNINNITTVSTFTDYNKVNMNLIEGSLSYCLSIMELSYDIKFNDKQSKWIASSLAELLLAILKDTFK